MLYSRLTVDFSWMWSKNFIQESLNEKVHILENEIKTTSTSLHTYYESQMEAIFLEVSFVTYGQPSCRLLCLPFLSLTHSPTVCLFISFPPSLSLTFSIPSSLLLEEVVAKSNYSLGSVKLPNWGGHLSFAEALKLFGKTLRKLKMVD